MDVGWREGGKEGGSEGGVGPHLALVAGISGFPLVVGEVRVPLDEEEGGREGGEGYE